MLRLRFLRLLLPAAILVFVALLVVALRERPAPVGVPHTDSGDTLRTAEEFRFIELEGSNKTLDFRAELADESPGGGLHLEGIEELAVSREGRSPLIIRAEAGEITGEPGSRMMRFDEEVVVRDPDASLTVVLPTLHVDEKAARATSSGDVTFEGPDFRGGAREVVYDLEGETTQLREIQAEGTGQSTLRADSATLHDGLDDVEFVGHVRLTQPDRRLDSGRLRLLRSAGELRELRAGEGVVGTGLASDQAPVGIDAGRLIASWDALGELERVELLDAAELRHATRSLSGSTIVLERSGAGAPWRLAAEGTVYVRGLVGIGPVWLRTERLVALIGEDRKLVEAEATGGVRMEGPRSSSESERAVFVPTDTGGDVRLFGSPASKARLARDLTRVAAVAIRTDLRGDRLIAEEQVEATLLAEPPSAPAQRVQGMFRTDEAVHFVAARLESEGGGQRFEFSGQVRGWQGERSLAARRIIVDQTERRLQAFEDVATRLPRERDQVAARQADYALITADELDYEERKSLATYRGGVRVRLAEGWLESGLLEVELEPDGDGMRELRAARDVRLEFRGDEEGEAPEMLVGRCDRLVYVPAEATVWLIGESEPATVRRLGEREGTTSARVLRYRLDDRTLEVDAGSPGPARFRTGGG